MRHSAKNPVCDTQILRLRLRMTITELTCYRTSVSPDCFEIATALRASQ